MWVNGMGLLEKNLKGEDPGVAAQAIACPPSHNGGATVPLPPENSHSHFLQLAENIPASFWLVDIAERRVVFANAAYESVWGRQVSELFRDRMDWMHAIHPEDAAQVSSLVNLARRGGMDTEFRVLHPNGQLRWLHMRTFPIADAAGTVHSVGGVAYDVSDFVLQKEALQAGEARQRRAADVQRAVLDALPAQVSILDDDGRIIAANAQWQSFADSRGLSEQQAGVGLDYLEVFRTTTGNDTALMQQGIRDVIAGQTADYCQIYPCEATEGKRWFRVNLTPLHETPPHGVLVTHFDITERMQAEEQLTQLAHYDSLTRLPNRFLFRDRLHSALSMARRNDWQLAVLFVDLDRFKAINDTLGHLAGDGLLQQAARRIQACIRESDTVGRLGGDEFALVLAELAQPQGATLVARKVVNALARPFVLDGTEVFVTASIGITLFPTDADDVDALIRNADTAMYRAKESGRNNFQFFTPEMNRQATTKMQLENDLRRAVAKQEFSLVYQPKVSCVSGHIVGFEALIRWQHPRRGMVSPVEFIGVLEDTGLIAEVGEWVLRTACRDTLGLHQAGLGTPTVAVNLSGRQLQSEQLFDVVKNALEETGLAPRYLELELTESFLMKKPETAITTLSRLKELGVHISIDDFGTGYSSLSYLKRFPIDALKVDRSFVQDITADPDDASITRAIIKLAHSLKLQVVAEGVETEGQLALLIAHHCDIIQGYYFSRPVPLADIQDMLARGKCLPGGLLARSRAARSLLLIGDAPEFANMLEQVFAHQGYTLHAAGNREEALAILAREQVDVLLCQETLAGQATAEFLQELRLVHPDCLSILLCDDGDLGRLNSSMDDGTLFRVLVRPWSDESLRHTAREAFHSREQVQENQRLDQQLHQSNADLNRATEHLARVQAELDLQRERQAAIHDLAQDILESIPLPVMGVDPDGMVAMANGEAEGLLGNGMPLLGSEAAECLPTEVLQWLADAAGPANFRFKLYGQGFRIGRRPMAGRSAGLMLTFHAETA